jgi:hypothetical protein
MPRRFVRKTQGLRVYCVSGDALHKRCLRVTRDAPRRYDGGMLRWLVVTMAIAGCAGDQPTVFEDDAGEDATTGDVTDTFVPPDDTLDGGTETIPIAETSGEIGDVDVEAAVDADAIADATVETMVDAPADTPSDASVCTPATFTSAKGACDHVIQTWDDFGALHHPAGTALTYCTSPPSSGDHYDQWAAFRVYDKPVPYGYLVHSLEHGAVILLYKCASGSCPTIQSQLVAVADARPVDPFCMDPVKRRIIIAPDPTLDVEIGAAAWRWTYRASCVHAASLGKFIDDHYAKTPEDFCADGVVPP